MPVMMDSVVELNEPAREEAVKRTTVQNPSLSSSARDSRKAGKDLSGKAEKDLIRQRELNESFLVESLNESEAKQKWLAINYVKGTFADAKKLALKENKPLYVSVMVDGPEPEVTCLGSRLFKSTVLSDPRIIDRLNKEFVC